jgi:hypothetical protein
MVIVRHNGRHSKEEEDQSVEQTFPRRGHVIQDYHADYPDPIVAQAGERIAVTELSGPWHERPDWVWIWCINQRGKGGWVPQTYIAQQGKTATLLCDYSAHELEAQTGTMVTVERAESGWYWCQNQQGEHGWLPIDQVQVDDQVGG